MKAIVCPRYGSPDVLVLNEVAIPALKDDQVLVKVRAASVNPVDWHHMRGAPFLVRLGGGVFKPKDTGLGADVAGVVEAVGGNVTQFKPGDEVFGGGPGTFAEYAAVPETLLALKPPRLSFEQAAAVPVAAYTALQGLRDSGKIQRGQTVLINGASGGVGTMAVQLAEAYGAEVTAVCSGANTDLVRSIGADHVIDYTKQDFTEGSARFDLIFDAVGNHTAAEFERVLNAGGAAVVAGFSSMAGIIALFLQGPRVSKKSGKTIGIMPTAHQNQPDLLVLREFLETGKLVPVIDRQYPLAQTAEAIRYLETGRAKGKVVIVI